MLVVIFDENNIGGLVVTALAKKRLFLDATNINEFGDADMYIGEVNNLSMKIFKKATLISDDGAKYSVLLIRKDKTLVRYADIVIWLLSEKDLYDENKENVHKDIKSRVEFLEIENSRIIPFAIMIHDYCGNEISKCRKIPEHKNVNSGGSLFKINVNGRQQKDNQRDLYNTLIELDNVFIFNSIRRISVYGDSSLNFMKKDYNHDNTAFTINLIQPTVKDQETFYLKLFTLYLTALVTSVEGNGLIDKNMVSVGKFPWNKIKYVLGAKFDRMIFHTTLADFIGYKKIHINAVMSIILFILDSAAGFINAESNRPDLSNAVFDNIHREKYIYLLLCKKILGYSYIKEYMLALPELHGIKINYTSRDFILQSFSINLYDDYNNMSGLNGNDKNIYSLDIELRKNKNLQYKISFENEVRNRRSLIYRDENVNVSTIIMRVLDGELNSLLSAV